jgi:hypothetical protein
LSTPAIALAYTTTEYFDRSTLATTIASFPASLVRLNVVRRRLALRRCILIEAERRTFGAKPPVHFRGRLYPIYDKDLAKKMRDEKMANLAVKAKREVISSIARGIALRAPRSLAAARWAAVSVAEGDKSGVTDSNPKATSGGVEWQGRAGGILVAEAGRLVAQAGSARKPQAHEVRGGAREAFGEA